MGMAVCTYDDSSIRKVRTGESLRLADQPLQLVSSRSRERTCLRT